LRLRFRRLSDLRLQLLQRLARRILLRVLLASALARPVRLTGELQLDREGLGVVRAALGDDPVARLRAEPGLGQLLQPRLVVAADGPRRRAFERLGKEPI